MKKNWDETSAQRREAAFDYPYERPAADDTGHRPIKAHPKLPYRCQFCANHFAFPWTRDGHLRKAHAALLPGPQPTRSTGPVPCRWCPNGYRNQEEATLHETARHARNLALDKGL